MTCHQKLKTTALFSLFLLFSSAEAADTPLDSLLSMPMDQLMQVDAQVESSSRIVQDPRDLPQPITVLSASDIRAFGYRTLTDVLNGLPGIYTSSDRTYSYLGARGMIASGSFNSRVLVTIDGMRINDNIYQQVGMSGNEFPLDVDLIDRVEFVPGPGSVSYGNNAFLGVVNVVTRSAASRDHGEVASALDSNGALYKRGTAHVPVAGGHAMISLSQLDAPGAAIDYPEIQSTTQRAMDQDQNQKLFIKYERGPLYFNLISSDRTKTIPSRIVGTQFNDPNTQYRDRWLIGNLGYQLLNTQNQEWSTRVHWGQYQFNGNYAMPNASDSYREASEGRWWGIDLKGVWRGITGHQISGGVQLQDNGRQWLYAKKLVSAVPVIDSARSTQTYALWLEDQFSPWQSAKLTLGARLDQDMQQQTQFSPRVGLVQNMGADDRLRVNLARNFLTPSDYELRYASHDVGTGFQAPNLALQAESMTSLDIGWEHQSTMLGRTMLSAFQYQADNLIELTSLPSGQSQHQNVGNSKGQGVQLEWQRNWSDWRVTASATLQNVTDSGSGLRVDSPEHLFKLQLRTPRVWGIQPAFEGVHFSERLARNGTHLKAASLVNFTLSKQLTAQLMARFSVYNAFDNHYETPVSVDYPMAFVQQEGRVVRLKLEWQF